MNKKHKAGGGKKGKKYAPPSLTKSLRMPVTRWEDMERAANMRGINLTEAVNQAVAQWLLSVQYPANGLPL